MPPTTPGSLDSLVRVNPTDLEAQASTLRNKAGLIRQYLSTADERLAELLSPTLFEGASADIFRTHYREQHDVIMSLPQRLENYANRLTAAAAAIRSADQANSAGGTV